MIRVFAGFDPREEVGYHTFCSSVIHHSSEPVSIAPVRGDQRDGSNAFTYSRFAVPQMLQFSGWALFMDGSDMVCVGDIAELWAMRDHAKCVQVVQHHYQTKHPRKYVGTQMEAVNENYPCKNWSSVMLMNCAHPDWRKVNPTQPGAYLHRFQFTDRIGALPIEWNWLPQEFGQYDGDDEIRLLHWTSGIACFDHYRDTPMAEHWHAARRRANYATP